MTLGLHHIVDGNDGYEWRIISDVIKTPRLVSVWAFASFIVGSFGLDIAIPGPVQQNRNTNGLDDTFQEGLVGVSKSIKILGTDVHAANTVQCDNSKKITFSH